jgi:Tfp pilus assembly protein PilO
MSGRAQIVVAAVVAALVSIAFFFFFVKPRQNELAEVNTQIEAAEAETVRLQADLDRLRALQENAPLLEARLNEIRDLIPEDDQVANFIFLVQDAATRSGVRFVQITPELPDVPPEGAQVAEVRVTIGGEGGYFAIQDFVRRLYLLDRALRIDSMTMTQEEDETTQELQVQMDSVARIFFELPASGATPGGATTAPAPAPSPSPTPTPAG